MKNYGTITIPKGTIGYESESGYNNWWYPDKSSSLEFPRDIKVEHLKHWRNQDPMMVFCVPLCAFKPAELFENARPKYITVWFHKEHLDEIINSQNA